MIGASNIFTCSKRVIKHFKWVENHLPTCTEIMLFHTGVSIRFMGVELTSGISRVCLSDIGEQLPGAKAMVGVPDTVEGPALVCVTNNPNCCRSVDNPNGGGVGDWTINGFSAPGMYANPQSRIYRNRGTGLVRINYQPSTEGADPPLVLIGQYCCTIPDMSGVFQTLCVEVNSKLSIKQTIENIYSLFSFLQMQFAIHQLCHYLLLPVRLL